MSAVEKACVIEGQFVGTMIIPFSSNHTSKISKKVICPLCRKQIKDGTDGRFFGCNYKHFPNSVCHPDCVSELGGYEAVSLRLKEMNDRFVKLKSELRDEFGIIGWV
jgi:hypothetical protein